MTSLDESHDGKQLYEEVYCARGESENRIKEQQLDLFARRTSGHLMRVNQMRLWFSAMAYLLINEHAVERFVRRIMILPHLLERGTRPKDDYVIVRRDAVPQER